MVERKAWPPSASLEEAEVRALHEARHAEPSNVLGCHTVMHEGKGVHIFRVWHKRLEKDWAADKKAVVLQLVRVGAENQMQEIAVPMTQRCPWLYEAVVSVVPGPGESPLALHSRLRYTVDVPDGGPALIDGYAFGGSLISEEEIDQMHSGIFPGIANVMGSHCVAFAGMHGVSFMVWAPRARAVSVVGDWNEWDGRASPMRQRFRPSGGFVGIWELFIPFGPTRDSIPAGGHYGYQIQTPDGATAVRIDPFAQEFECPPTDIDQAPATNSSRLSLQDDAFRPDPFQWGDNEWLEARDDLRRKGVLLEQPMAVYEVHLPSWRRTETGGFVSYRDLAPLLLAHVQKLHFNYVELIGLAHHPFSGSWGYQVSGYYGCYPLLGSPDDFKFLVDTLHKGGIGIIMDFVPAHFCKDSCSFAHYDGTATFEYEDPREGEQKDWGTKVFNWRRSEVRSFLIGAALFWAERYHIDGFRCDAVSSMVYRNFCTQNGFKREGEWVPNEQGNNANLEAVSFLRDLNGAMREYHPGVVMIAEESHAWGGVTAEEGEHFSWLGFDLKWDLGWMNDTLTYMRKPSGSKPDFHAKLVNRQLRIERWVVPLSHDESATFKGSLMDKMGIEENLDFYGKLKMLAALYGYQVASIGRPLLFMGGEIGQGRSWDGKHSVDWHEGNEPLRGQLCTWVSDLMGVYLHHKALHAGDDSRGLANSLGKIDSFEWVESNPGACVLAFMRSWGKERPVLAICNFSNREHHNYGMSVPFYGEYEVLLNSDDSRYGGRGCGPGNMAKLRTSSGGCPGWFDSIWLNLPAQSCMLLSGPEDPMNSRSGGSKHFGHGACPAPAGDMYCNEGYIGDDAWLGM